MAIVKKYPAKVIAIHNSIEGVYTLEFESMGKPFKYLPGQFLHLAIDSDYDGLGQWPDSRCFSMQSNPDEEILKITYSLKGMFTNKMKQSLKVGYRVWLKLPYGDLFTQPHNKTNTVFIAGGTGITPFLSLFTHDSFNKYINPKIYLGFRSNKHNIYQTELDKLCNSNSTIEIFFEDIDGILDIKNIINTNCPDSTYFISGPPAMINNFKQILMLNGVASINIITDSWK